MDGDLLLMPMFPVHIVPLADLEAAGIEETDEVHPLHALHKTGAVHLLSAQHRTGAVHLLSAQHRTGAVHLLSGPRNTGAAQPLRVLHRSEALRWALRVNVVVC